MSKKNKKRKEGETQAVIDWEEDGYFPRKIKEEMKSMWEIPQIYQFLHFTKDILNIPQITIYEMERMLVIPRASKQLANIMTCLLSCPIIKAKLHKIPPMPYEFWTNILMHKINNWFKLYYGKHKDVIKVLETIGIEPEFWDIFPEASIFADRDFEDLSFKQRVWLLKTICDTLMHTRKTIQEEIANHAWEDQVEINLGTDRHGAKYIYFPQFISSELRIYRHCMNNNILSTSKPIIPKTVAESETKTKVNNPVQGKVKKSRKRKARWQNGLCSKIKKDKSAKPPENKIDKQFYICNCIDSAMNSQTSEDTNSSCTSTNSNSSNNNNNNNMNLNNLDRKRTRNSLKTSEISTMSNNTKYSNTSSNSYNNVSNENQLIDKNLKESTFKGFSRSSNEKDGIAIINQLLIRLKTEMDMKYINSHVIVENMTDTKDDIENSISMEANENNFESISNECDSSKQCLDNLSNNSKTDDEKLNEIIVIGNTILKDKTFSTNSEDINDLDSSTSKSDDEKLNETETSIINKMKNISNDVPDTINKCNIKQRKRSSNNGEMKDTKKKDNIINESFLEIDETQNCIRRSLRTKGNLQMEHKSFCNDINQIINTDINTEKVENKLKKKNETASFKKMLKELGVSNFQLVADSVETLRNLISSFSLNTPESCEVKLVNKLTELLKSVENVETVLKDTTKKAKAKLLKEWTNFKIGVYGRQAAVCCSSMEDQDSSSESGVSSNWWILGSQDYKLPTANDATLQTLSKSTLSPISTQSCVHSSECNDDEEQCTSGKEKEYKKSKSKEHDEKSNDREQQENGENSEGKNQRKHKEDKECNRKEEEQQTRRVLRARGISSYTEQLYPYEEIDESELGEWTDIKAVYAPPSAQTCTSTTYSSSKNRHDNNWSEKEDSDQDWILPGSRRRKNKRSSNNKKLRSLQAKNLNKKTNLVQDTSKESTSNHKIFNNPKELTTSIFDKIKYPQIQQDSVRTISSIEASKIEYVDSVHSELDIKDETPILDNVSNQYKNNYNMNGISYLVQSNPTVIGLTQPNTFVQTNSLIPNIVPSFQPNYYMQEVQPEYVVYDQQPSFVPLQQSIIQQVPCIVTSQEIMNHSKYSPYFINAMKSNSNLPNDQLPKCQPENSNLIKIVQPDNNVNKIPQKKASTSQSNSNITKHNTTKRYTLNSTSQKAKDLNRNINDPKKKTTSLIILSDSDDEVEIINEKTTNNQKDKSPQNQESNITEIANNALKNIIPQEIMQRIHQGCISITPIKPAPIQNTPTQLVVVVNETGNYYALALPNGSKLILTPEQVAQIRASNGGKLVL
ncbi:MATH and LRR domain-containing protein PFE0570w-like isoform X4 [Vespula squamosa]|uniref:MATH and LRR domain-containing protein PFE0570w-like isoform X4 n=1 Tax=Vespula squamosa TaxID=30214 RepID=A0ABD2BDL7_VESSQ